MRQGLRQQELPKADATDRPPGSGQPIRTARENTLNTRMRSNPNRKRDAPCDDEDFTPTLRSLPSHTMERGTRATRRSAPEVRDVHRGYGRVDQPDTACRTAKHNACRNSGAKSSEIAAERCLQHPVCHSPLIIRLHVNSTATLGGRRKPQAGVVCAGSRHDFPSQQRVRTRLSGREATGFGG